MSDIDSILRQIKPRVMGWISDALAAKLNNLTFGMLSTEPLVDYSAVSTILGWSSFTQKRIFYTKIGSLVFVSFDIQGTSNSLYARFTVPYSNTLSVAQLFFARISDNGGTPTASVGTMSEGADEIRVYTTPAGGTFTASGTKEIIGQMWFRT